MMKLNMFIIFVINIVVTRCHHHHHHKLNHHQFVNILKSQENSNSITSETVKTIMNSLFEDVHLSKQFIASSRIKSLLTMLYDLNNMAGNNNNFYETLKNITKVDANNKAVIKIGLDEMVREIVNENKFEANNITKEKDREDTVSTLSVTEKTKLWQPMSEFKDSTEFNIFIESFIKKVNSLTVDDLFENSPSDVAYEAKKSRRTLEAWEPPADLLNMHNETNYRRIYGGRSTNIQKFPFIVSVHILKDYKCSGSLIADDLVITAASCMQTHFNNRFYRENPRTTTVRVGSDYVSQCGEKIRVLEIFFYPTYDPKSLRNNLAILRLGRAIKFRKNHKTKVKRISLDKYDGNLPSNVREIIILGWGATSSNQIADRLKKLRAAVLQVYPLDACQEVYSKEYVNHNNFCAGFIAKGGGACNGDVGAPGIVSGRLAGLASFGSPDCGAENAPTVFIKLGNYIDWIEKIMKTRTPRFGAPKTTKATSLAYHYYHNYVVQPKLMIQPLPEVENKNRLQFRATNKNNTEEAVLSELISNFGKQNNSLVQDVINEAFSEESKETTQELDSEEGLSIPVDQESAVFRATDFPDILNTLEAYSNSTESSTAKITFTEITTESIFEYHSNQFDGSEYGSKQTEETIASQEIKTTIVSQESKKTTKNTYAFASHETAKPSLRTSPDDEYVIVFGENEKHGDELDDSIVSENSGNEYTSVSMEIDKPAQIADNNESVSPDSGKSLEIVNDDHDSKDRSFLKLESYEKHGSGSDESTTTHQTKKIILVTSTSTSKSLIYKLLKEAKK